MALNTEPDPTGRYILLRDDRSAFRIPDAELERILEGRNGYVNPDTQARRFRDHASTCLHGFPTYNIPGAYRPQRQNPFLRHREKLRQVKLDLERARNR